MDLDFSDNLDICWVTGQHFYDDYRKDPTNEEYYKMLIQSSHGSGFYDFDCQTVTSEQFFKKKIKTLLTNGAFHKELINDIIVEQAEKQPFVIYHCGELQNSDEIIDISKPIKIWILPLHALKVYDKYYTYYCDVNDCQCSQISNASFLCE